MLRKSCNVVNAAANEGADGQCFRPTWASSAHGRAMGPCKRPKTVVSATVGSEDSGTYEQGTVGS